MKVKKQFNKYAKEYEKYSIIQQNGLKELINLLPKNMGDIIDLGCGSGRIYKELINQNITFNKFIGVDFSKEMLKLHPKTSNIQLIEGDFNTKELFRKLPIVNFILSASSLQWAKDLDFTFKQISKKTTNVAFFIFSNNTFKSIHSIVDKKSPIHSKKAIIASFNKYFTPTTIKELNYQLEFENNLEMLRYIKKSGVSGGGIGLGIKEVKKIINNYYLNYLEFETILLKGKSL